MSTLREKASDTAEVGDGLNKSAGRRLLIYSIFTTGAELCERLDKMIELDERRVAALEAATQQGSERLELDRKNSKNYALMLAELGVDGATPGPTVGEEKPLGE